MDYKSVPTKDVIEESHRRIRSLIHETPVMTSSALDEMTGGKLLFKCENFQKVGAFKFRGASNRVFSLSDAEAARGVVTHSSGNHAQALALAARMRGIPAYIVMPENAPAVKVAAVKGYGGQVTFCAPTQAAREKTAERIVEERGAFFVPPYDDYGIIAGQATCAKEVFDKGLRPDIIMPPVGGGGLLAGTALSARYFAPSVKVWASEPAGADDAFRSFTSGTLIPQNNPQTVADGLRVGLGRKNFPIIREGVEKILTCREDSIISAMRLIWERMKIVVEPSGAVPLAAVMEHPDLFRKKTVLLIISGGNVDLGRLPWL